MSEHHSVIIIGAGLSGLYTAWRLQQKKQDVVLLEARERTGGRILSSCIDDQGDACVDLGPAWLWPQLQPRLQQLITEFDVKLFKQFTSGEILYEQNASIIERHSGPSSHNQSYRVAGGSRAITDALQARLPTSSIHLNTQVTSINQLPMTIQAMRNGEPYEYSADKVILALPPRISGQSIEFTPPLDDELLQLWKSTPTWMAGHCKMVFVYDRAFWREQNLSGEVFSRHGPLTEIYDGSPANEAYYALTAFVGLTAQNRQQVQQEQLIESCLAQLHRLFGETSRNVKDIQIKDWSTDRFTTTDIDLNSMAHHPQYPDSAERSFWNNQIILAGTETAREHGGYLEGALESADEALSILHNK